MEPEKGQLQIAVLFTGPSFRFHVSFPELEVAKNQDHGSFCTAPRASFMQRDLEGPGTWPASWTSC